MRNITSITKLRIRPAIKVMPVNSVGILTALHIIRVENIVKNITNINMAIVNPIIPKMNP